MRKRNHIRTNTASATPQPCRRTQRAVSSSAQPRTLRNRGTVGSLNAEVAVCKQIAKIEVETGSAFTKFDANAAYQRPSADLAQHIEYLNLNKLFPSLGDSNSLIRLLFSQRNVIFSARVHARMASPE
jgi:hypothetical protein